MLFKCGNVNGETCFKEHSREPFPYKRPLRKQRLLEQIRSGKLFCYVQCDIEVPEELKKILLVSHPLSKIKNVGWHDIGLLMQDYNEKDF